MRKLLKTVLMCFVLAGMLLVPGIARAAADIAQSNLVILEDKNVGGLSKDVTVVVGAADIKGDVDGSVVVVFGKATIDGRVSGDVVSAFGEIYLKDSSEIKGNLVSVGKLEKSASIRVEGVNVSVSFDLISFFKSNGVIINTLIILSIATLVIGLVLITLFTERFRCMSYAMNRELSRKMMLGGLVVLSVTIVLTFLIFLLVVPVLYIIFIMLADIVASIYLGTIIFKNNYDKSAIYLEFFVGHILISFVKIVPLILLPASSYVALMIYGICFLIIELGLASYGVGTVIDTAFGKKCDFFKKND